MDEPDFGELGSIGFRHRRNEDDYPLVRIYILRL